MNNNKKAFALLFGVGFSLTAISQESVNASGETINSAGGGVSYSVGQVVYQNYINSNGSVEQGVQHAYEIVSAGLSQVKLNFKVDVFPNPTVDALNLSIEQFQSNMMFQLYSENGQLIESRPIAELSTLIDMKNYSPGTYVLNLLSNQEQVESFRIIKK
jgi:hypothetical protein